MPVYAFVCKQCQHAFTVLASYSQKEQSQCPKCQAKDLKENYSGYGAGKPSSKGGSNFT